MERNFGTIDFVKSENKLYAINLYFIALYKGAPIIEISTSPYSNDVIGLQDLYLQLDINNTFIKMVSDSISSGADISGTNYTVSSSYSNGIYVR